MGDIVRKDYKYYSVPVHSTATVGTASGKILDARTARTYGIVINDSLDNIYISLGQAAVVGGGIKITPNGNFEMSGLMGNLYDGEIYAIAETSGGNNVLVTEGHGV